MVEMLWKVNHPKGVSKMWVPQRGEQGTPAACALLHFSIERSGNLF